MNDHEWSSKIINDQVRSKLSSKMYKRTNFSKVKSEKRKKKNNEYKFINDF